VSPSEAKEVLVSRCQDLQRTFEGHSVPTRTLLLRLKEQLAPLVEHGLHRTDIYDTIRSSGLDVSSTLVFEVLRTLFGPSRLTHKIPVPVQPAPQQSISEESLPIRNLAPLEVPERDFRMSFGTDKEAEEQQERLARARAKIEAERQRKRIQAAPRQK
jgi:hypothetical protein